MNFKNWLFENESHKPTQIGKYHIFYIDSKKFRNSSLENEEFCTIAIHQDFPKSIGKNEIWIDNSVSKSELPALLKGATNRLKELERKNNSKTAYTVGMTQERCYRKRHKSEIKKKKYCNIHDEKSTYHVYFVSGKAVRDNFKTDFSQGGHGYVYDWIPKNEIWLEKEEHDESSLILIHEYAELVLMRDKKMKYEKAHPIASKIEMKFRENKMKIDDIHKVPKLVNLYFKKNGF